LELTKKLINHPSDDVKFSALTQLSFSTGRSVLPVLFDELKTTQSPGVVSVIVMNVLLLDQSDETVRQLKNIAAKAPDSGKAKLIETHTTPRNIERLRKN